MKASGLSILPSPWTPPFFVVSTHAYKEWRDAPSTRDRLLRHLGEAITASAGSWPTNWNSGLLLRSSAVGESLADRGENETIPLTADYDPIRIGQAIDTIYSKFDANGNSGEIALVVQARVSTLALGHLSNEQRVSKTRNQWVWESETAPDVPRNINTQRDQPPNTEHHLSFQLDRDLVKRFREVGRWCTLLEVGRTHVEWGATKSEMWIFQIDFENDRPDEGFNPEELFRNVDVRETGEPPNASPFKKVSLSDKTGWRKIDKVSDFVVDRPNPYPKLFWITGDELLAALSTGADLSNDLRDIVHGRAICRTDCHAEGIPTLNLPRTESVSEQLAIEFMSNTLDSLGQRGASANEICFILHKFIPATSAAWAVAYPDKQIVRVDSLWGLPDGLQFLPHDTFEYDVKRQSISAERIRYKPRFLQEMPDGSWQVISVSRRFGRHRSLSRHDTEEVAKETHKIAVRLNRPIQIMWFCGIPETLQIGRNVPWFSMPPEKASSKEASISPALARFTVKSMHDLDEAKKLQRGRHVLHLNPVDPDLFRSEDFLNRVASVAESGNFPIIITGSILSHAFYMLDKRGLVVVSADEPNRSRTRRRQVFNKLVRDNIPDQINEHGERAALATIAKSESRPALVVKLLEEAYELLGAQTPEEVSAELADLLEVVRSLCSATGVDWSEVQQIAEAKRLARGSFDKNVVLVETSWPAGIEGKRNAEPTPIKLADLGETTSDMGKHTMPFAALLATGAPRTLRLQDGRTLTFSMNGMGLHIEEDAASAEMSGQLNLDL